jgi:hypothetical protein
VPVDWMGCEEPREDANQVDEPLTEYGIRKKVQKSMEGSCGMLFEIDC